MIDYFIYPKVHSPRLMIFSLAMPLVFPSFWKCIRISGPRNLFLLSFEHIEMQAITSPCFVLLHMQANDYKCLHKVWTGWCRSNICKRSSDIVEKRDRKSGLCCWVLWILIAWFIKVLGIHQHNNFKRIQACERHFQIACTCMFLKSA